MNTNTDGSHCGACGVSCPTGVCIGGACAAIPKCFSGNPKILVYGPTGTAEQSDFPVGSIVTVADTSAWNTMTATDFAKFQLIVIGEKNCSGPTAGDYNVAYNKRATWNSVVTGRIVINGLTPSCANNASSHKFLKETFKNLTTGPTTALYVAGDWGRRSLDFLESLGTFASAAETANDVTILTPSHPMMTGNTSASLSNWNQSIRTKFTAFPSSFAKNAERTAAPKPPVVISRSAACAP